MACPVVWGPSPQRRMHGLLLTAVGKWLRKAQEHGTVV